ncbi:MAG: CoA pyrophosphatase [Haliangiales bacterium]
MDLSLKRRIEHNLAGFQRRPPRAPTAPAAQTGEPTAPAAPAKELRRAAVALAIVDDDGGHACVVLTRRPVEMPRHPGQYALPGGRLDPGEGEVDTARRELAEEVGLTLPASAVLGQLDDFATRSGWLITPVVMWGGPGVSLRPDPREVAAVYRVRLDDLMAAGVSREHRIPESERPVLSLGIVGTRVYAPTAAILLQLCEVGVRGRQTRVAHYEQPLFAWR